MSKIVFLVTPYLNREASVIYAPFSAVKFINKLPEFHDDLVLLDFDAILKKDEMLIDYDFYHRCTVMIMAYQPSIVVFLSTSYINFSSSLVLAQEIKKIRSNTVVIFGGHQSSLHADYILDHFSFIDYVVYGNSIESGVELIRQLHKHNSAGLIANVMTKKERMKRDVVLVDPSDCLNLFKNTYFEYPYRVNGKLYLLVEMGYRCGCNCIKCTMCVNCHVNVCYEWRCILEQLFRLDVSQVHYIYLYDLFLYNTNIVEKLLQGLCEKAFEIEWCTRAELSAVCSGRMFKLLKESGCKEILVSVDRRKHHTYDARLYKIASLASEYQLNVTICVVIGVNYEITALLDFIFAQNLNPYVFFELSLLTDSAYQDGQSCVNATMRGIDFVNPDEYLPEDFAFIKAHPVLFGHFYSNLENIGYYTFLSDYSVKTIKYFYHSVRFISDNFYNSRINDFFIDVYNKVYIDDNDFWRALYIYMLRFSESNQVLQYEYAIFCACNKIYNKCINALSEDVYIARVPYNRKTMQNEYTCYVFIIAQRRTKSFIISEMLYQSLLQNRGHSLASDLDIINSLKL